MTLAAVCLALAQDPRAAVGKLGDDNPAVREQAQRELVGLGGAALAVLKDAASNSTDPEVRERASKAITEIGRLQKLRSVYPPPRSVSVDFKDAPLKDVLADLGRKTGLSFLNHAPAADAMRVTLRRNNAPILQVLDDVSRALQDRTLRFSDDKQIALESEPFVACPSAYTEAFRLRATRVEKQLINTFDKLTANVRLTLAPDWEKTVSPADAYQLEILQVSDAAGRNLSPGRASTAGRGIGGGTFVFSSVDPATATLKNIRVRATFRFPLDILQVRFVDPKPNDSKPAGEYIVRLQTVERNYMMINVQCPAEAAAQSAAETFDPASFETVDPTGKAARTDVAVSGLIDPRTFQFYAITRGAAVKEIRFNLRDMATLPFEFRFDEIPVPR